MKPQTTSFKEVLIVIVVLALASLCYGFWRKKQRKLLEYQQTLQKLV